MEPSRLLVFNAGSSSLKYAAYEAVDAAAQPRLLWRETVAAGAAGIAGAIARLRASPENAAVRGVGHRVVHGGPDHAGPARVDATVAAELERLVSLAPLHQPQGLALLRAATQAWPEAAQVACFDTAFHRTQPAVAREFALPEALRAAGLQRYGFHGLSCEHALGELRRLAPAPVAAGRVIVAHLGAGASLTAVLAGRSVANSMGFSTLDGLTMATRCGALDPGVILQLLRDGHDLASIERILYHESGLLGLSGSSGDARLLLHDEAGDERARFALQHFVYRCVREAGSLVAALGGLDALVFTGGVGEHQPLIRARIVEGLRWLGVGIDPGRNAANGPWLSSPGAAIACLVIPSDEEAVIARAVAGCLRT